MPTRRQIEATKAFGEQVNFGAASTDYGRFRAGFPDAFFRRLQGDLNLRPGLTGLDVGTGTGVVARGLAKLGLQVFGIDPSEDLLDVAVQLEKVEGAAVRY